MSESLTPAAQARHTSPGPGPSPAPAFQPWATLLDEKQARSEARAWRVAWCAMFLALVAVCGIVALAPYRRVVPFLLAMDHARGGVFPIGAVDQRTIKGYQELLDQHWVRRYVTARESYNYRLLQEDYDTVFDMSDEQERDRFAARFEGPAARDKLYGDKAEITVTISSVQLIRNPAGTQATVRFNSVLRRGDTGLNEATRYHIVTMAYRYRPSMFGSELALVRNPLGFTVEAYRLADELPPAHPATGKPATQGD